MNSNLKFILIVFPMLISGGIVGFVISKLMSLNVSKSIILIFMSFVITFCIGLFFIEKIMDYVIRNEKQNLREEKQ